MTPNSPVISVVALSTARKMGGGDMVVIYIYCKMGLATMWSFIVALLKQLFQGT